jgi:tRNA-guanine family transglycosylase
MVNTFKENKLIYIPVTITPRDIEIKYPSSAASLGKGKQLSWWSNDSLFPYNAVLISAYHGMEKIKDRSEIRDDVFFFGDSGGYQVLQNKLGIINDPKISKKLTWEKVIKWQMKVCDIGMTLDTPTPRKWDQIKDSKIFEDRLEESKKNALAMLEYKDKHIEEAYNSDFQLFNCIQGGFYEDMERWNDVTTNYHDYEYDGFAFANSKMKYILPLRLGFAIEHSKGKPFHILGTSSPSQLAMIAYANKYTNTQVYFDSSSAGTGKTLRKFMLFWDFSGNGVTFRENPKYEDFRTLACHCPVCSQLEKPEDLWTQKTTSGTLITLHNLYWMTIYTNYISSLAYCEEEFKIYVTKLTRNNSLWILQYMEFLDYVNENGLETAWNKYFKRNELSDPFLVDESNTENCDILMLNAAYNSKIQNLQKSSISIATKTCNDMMKKETLNPDTQEIVKVGELVEEGLAEFPPSFVKICQKRNVKKVMDLWKQH